jgi:hypothetical protein
MLWRHDLVSAFFKSENDASITSDAIHNDVGFFSLRCSNFGRGLYAIHVNAFLVIVMIAYAG